MCSSIGRFLKKAFVCLEGDTLCLGVWCILSGRHSGTSWQGLRGLYPQKPFYSLTPVSCLRRFSTAKSLLLLLSLTPLSFPGFCQYSLPPTCLELHPITMHRANSQGYRFVQPTTASLTLIPDEWNPIFETDRQDLEYLTENKPLIEGREIDESIVRTFMQGPDDSDICHPQADKVEAYCFGASLDCLRKGGESTLRPNAYLDERSFLGGGEPCRSRLHGMPLTSFDLYRELSKPRFCSGNSIHSIGKKVRADRQSENGVTTSVATPKSPDEKEIEKDDQDVEIKAGIEEYYIENADRQLIFITDLDRWSMYALIGTASPRQSPGLRGAIYKHLAFENFIGVTIPSRGLKMFQLAFNLPYYTLRKSQKAQEDHRRDDNARPLRQSRNVSFLDWTSSSLSSFLYEAQISCLVSGTDKWRWVAYFFVDNYFDVEGDGKETVLQYYQDSEDEGGMPADPLTYGTCDSNKPIWDPRVYFLTVFRIRIRQVKNEWQQVVVKVEESIRDYVYVHEHSVSLSGQRSTAEEADDHDAKARKSRTWVIQVRMLTKLLLIGLSKTVNACEKFCTKYAIYFRNQSQPALIESYFAAIQETFDELDSLKQTLESCAERCDDFVRDLEHQLILENIEVGNRQHKVSQETKSLSIIMMISLPIALTSGIFSMDRNVIPFLPANFRSFVGLVSTFGFLGCVFLVAVLYHTRCWKVVEDLTACRRQRLNNVTKGPKTETSRLALNFLFRQSVVQADVERVEQLEPHPS